MHKPIIGILASPYINNEEKREQVFLTTFFIKFFKRNNIDFLVIPYNLSKIKLKTLLKNVDGLLFPGSQIGNYYYSHEFTEHLKKQKIILKMAKSINKSERLLPILSICHGFQNSMLIESNEDKNKLFIDVNAYYNYNKHTKFTKDGEKLSKFYNKSKKIVHNNKLGVSPKMINKTKKIKLFAKTKDKNNKEFIEIIKYKKYPFYGFQGHVERTNPELIIPYLIDVKKSYYRRCVISNKSCKIKNIVNGKTKKCKNISKRRSKCIIYNI